MLTDISLPVRRGNITRKLNWQSAKKNAKLSGVNGVVTNTL